MKTRITGLLIGLLFLVGIAVGSVTLTGAWGSGVCGMVSVDCTTQKIPATLIPPAKLALPYSSKTLATTGTNTITQTDICTSIPAAGACPLAGTDTKIGTGWIPDLSGTYASTATTVCGHPLSGNVACSASDVGLGSVTNDSQVKRSEMGAATGVATLGTDSKLVQYPSEAAPAYFTPSNPTNLTSTSYLMFGLGSTIKITPTKSGKVRFAISYFASGVGSTGLNNYKISYGTGVAPSNGTSATGTVIGGIYSGGITALAIDAGVPTPAAVVRNVIVTGLTPSTAYWFDVQGAKKSGNTSVGMTNIEVTLEELPY